MNRQDRIHIFVTAAGLILSFPPFPLGFIAWGILIPFFHVVRRIRSRSAFWTGYLTGLVWACGTVYWIGTATGIGLFLALAVFPLFFALYAFLQAGLCSRWGDSAVWAAPFIWTGIEILASFADIGFQWLSLAYTQTRYPFLFQYLPFTGAHGLTFWIVTVNAAAFFLIRSVPGQKRRTTGAAVLLAALFLFPVAAGLSVLSGPQPGEGEIRISLVQGNIDPYIKWSPDFMDSNFVIYERLTREAARTGPDLIVWPETAAPCYLRHRAVYLNRVRSFVDSLGVPLLTGAPDYVWIHPDTVNKYNAALLLRPRDYRIQTYYKMRLAPFSERVPFTEQLPFLSSLAQKISRDVGDYTPGREVKVFDLAVHGQSGPVFFSAIICFESIFPELVSDFVEAGAGFLVIITNDGWFGRTSGPYQHAQAAVLRAVENRVWIARCANTGVSCFIDPLGRVVRKTRLDEAVSLEQTVRLNPHPGKTPASRPFFRGFVLSGFLVCCVSSIPLLSRKGRKGGAVS
ncbi:apolipoprotein N-acyltransferase [bacterium]|nr:apolipoprotein N-acyltransferase [bacterium]